MNYTIEHIQEDRAKLERSLKESIRAFEANYGVQVKDIYMLRETVISGRRELYTVRFEVVLE